MFSVVFYIHSLCWHLHVLERWENCQFHSSLTRTPADKQHKTLAFKHLWKSFYYCPWKEHLIKVREDTTQNSGFQTFENLEYLQSCKMSNLFFISVISVTFCNSAGIFSEIAWKLLIMSSSQEHLVRNNIRPEILKSNW